MVGQTTAGFSPLRPDFDPGSGYAGFDIGYRGPEASLPLPVLIPPNSPHSSIITKPVLDGHDTDSAVK
jgi:hypothetical protein